MIDPLRLTLRSFFANALGFDTLLIQLNDTWSFLRLFAIFFRGNKETGNSYFFLKSTFINLSNKIQFAVFSFKMGRIRFFLPGGHPRKSKVTFSNCEKGNLKDKNQAYTGIEPMILKFRLVQESNP